MLFRHSQFKIGMPKHFEIVVLDQVLSLFTPTHTSTILGLRSSLSSQVTMKSDPHSLHLFGHRSTTTSLTVRICLRLSLWRWWWTSKAKATADGEHKGDGGWKTRRLRWWRRRTMNEGKGRHFGFQISDVWRRNSNLFFFLLLPL